MLPAHQPHREIAPSIEHAFADAIKRNDREPVRCIARWIRLADENLANLLFALDEPREDAYNRFFDRFDRLRFSNIQLRWFGRDRASLMLKRRATPRYEFDPGRARSFSPIRELGDQAERHRRAIGRPGSLQEETVFSIQPYVEKAYVVAKRLAAESSPIVAIGYSFNRHDKDSYAPILEACLHGSKRIVIVAPTPPSRRIDSHPNTRTYVSNTFRADSRSGSIRVI